MEGSPHTHQLTLTRNWQKSLVLTYGDTSIRVFNAEIDDSMVPDAEFYKALKIARNMIVAEHDRGSQAAALEARRAQEAEERRNQTLRLLQPSRPDRWFSEELVVEPPPPSPRAMPQKWSLLGG